MRIDLAGKAARKEVTSDEVLLLANAEKSPLWIFVQTLLSEQRTALYNCARTRGRLCDGDFPQDIRYQLGELDKVEDILSLPDTARKLLEAAII
jgi:hypothetical protein